MEQTNAESLRACHIQGLTFYVNCLPAGVISIKSEISSLIRYPKTVRKLYICCLLLTKGIFRCVPEAFYSVRTFEVVWGYSYLNGTRGEALRQNMVLEHFKGLKRVKTSKQLITISFFSSKIKLNTVKPVLSGHSKRRPKIDFQDQLPLNAGQKYRRILQMEYSAILLTFIKPPFVIKIRVFYALKGFLGGIK